MFSFTARKVPMTDNSVLHGNEMSAQHVAPAKLSQFQWLQQVLWRYALPALAVWVVGFTCWAVPMLLAQPDMTGAPDEVVNAMAWMHYAGWGVVIGVWTMFMTFAAILFVGRARQRSGEIAR